MFDKFLKLFGEKEEHHPVPVDYSGVVVEFHNHILPGIDDGAKTIDDSIMMLRQFEQLGYKKVVATPHSMAEGYVNPNDKILKLRDEVREAIAKNSIQLEFDAAAEYYFDEAFLEKVAKKDLLCISKNFVLMELNFSLRPNNLNEVIYKLQVADYNLILAHPERYSFFYEKDFESYESLKNRGVYFQINLGSLIGKYGAPAKYTAEKMIDLGMVEFVGSDLHTPNQSEMMQKCLKEKYLGKLLASGKLLNPTL
ncbi:MAG: capsular biosynthesis protein [Bacteroidetes bacterium]|nr:capsular biosynthesis protein [Bacteroidota bacterium]